MGAVVGDNRSDLLVQIEAGVERLRRDMRANEQTVQRFAQRSDRHLQQFDRRFDGLMRSVRGFGALFGVAFGAGAFARGIQHTISQTAALGDLADRLDVSAEALQRWRFAARQSGAEAADVDQGLERLTRRLGEFRDTGAGPAAAAFRRLGLDARIASGELQTSEDVFQAVVAALEGVESGADRAAIAGSLFGDRMGPRLATLIGRGTAALDEMGSQANVLENGMVQNAQRIQERWNAMVDNLTLGFRRLVLEGVDAIERFEARASRTPAMLDMDLQALLRTNEEILAVEQEIADLRAAGGTDFQAGFLERRLGRLLEMRRALQAPFDPAGDVEDRPSLVVDITRGTVVNPEDPPPSGGADGADRLAMSLRALMDQLDPLGAATRQLAEDQEILARALAVGLVEGEQYEDLLRRLAEATRDQLDPVAAYLEGLHAEAEILHLTLQDRHDVVELRRAEAELVEKLGRDLLPEEIRQLREALELRRELNEQLREKIQMERESEETTDGLEMATNRLGDSLAAAFADGEVDARRFLRLLPQILDMLLQIAGVSGGGGSGSGGLGTFLAGLFAAKGAAFAGGEVVPMARGGSGSGGILRRPTAFPMRSGSMAIGGELADEAILPLRRLPGGDLGVGAAPGGGGGGGGVTNIFNIDARGAQQGVAAEIRREVQALLPEIERRSVAAVARSGQRGGMREIRGRG